MIAGRHDDAHVVKRDVIQYELAVALTVAHRAPAGREQGAAARRGRRDMAVVKL